MPESPATLARRLLDHLTARREEMTVFLQEMVAAESPSTVPSSQERVQALLARALKELGLSVTRLSGIRTGGHLFAAPRPRARPQPFQMLLGHCDTVWPLGTRQRMPVELDGNVLRGPGAFDMKGGLTQGIFALRALRDLGVTPRVTPVVLVTSDEEIGSPESHRHIVRLARRACRTLVLEPALGPSGKIKTTRKGVGHFVVRVIGKSAHVGLAPEAGASAILELSHVIQKLHGLGDPARGITVNVGVIEGGLRANVVAPECRAEVDVRVWTEADARRMETAIRALESTTPGTRLEIEGEVGRAPMEATPRNVELWKAALSVAKLLGLELEPGASGGASDGNITSRFTATLDGLGSVGDGAHAAHEFVYVDKMVERAALLALILTLPPTADPAVGSSRPRDEG